MYKKIINPFLFWLGEEQKTISEEVIAAFPLELGVLLQRYLDPFVGRGTVLFEILNRYHLEEVIINDINFDLMNLYLQLKTRIDDVLEQLYTLQKNFYEHTGEGKWEFFKACRCRTGYVKKKQEDENIRNAALFLFINRAYRLDPYISAIVHGVQKKHNTAIDGVAKPVICDEFMLREVSAILKPVKILCCDFRECLAYADDSTFLYMDPPLANDRHRVTTDLSNRKTYPFPKTDDLSVTSFIKIARSFGAEVYDARPQKKKQEPRY